MQGLNPGLRVAGGFFTVQAPLPARCRPVWLSLPGTGVTRVPGALNPCDTGLLGFLWGSILTRPPTPSHTHSCCLSQSTDGWLTRGRLDFVP